MEGLINAIADAVAGILRAVGLVGSPRRRSGISDDLRLLRELEDFSQFAEGTFAHTAMVKRIDDEVAKHAGVSLKVPRKISWSSVIIWTVLWALLGLGTYLLDRDGFSWYSLLTGIPAATLFIATVGALLPESESPPEEEAETPEIPPAQGA